MNFLLELSGVDVNTILRSVYLFSNATNIKNVDGVNDDMGGCTHINITTQIRPEDNSHEIMFTDSKKCRTTLRAGTYDISANGPLPQATTIPCWNCRRKFSNSPLGIPIRFNKLAYGSYDREMWKRYLKEGNYLVPSDATPTSPSEVCGYFETEGVVCSWECMKNFVLENSNSARYKDSVGLMYLLHSCLVGKPLRCNRAGSWRILKEWGGHVDSKDFSDAIRASIFSDTTNVRRPLMFSISRYYEQN
jgi:hypothetical protein